MAAEKPASICEVLSDLDHFRGRLVTIRGILHGGIRHGLFLEDSAADKPCSRAQAQGHTWPPAIALVQFTKGADLEDGPTVESDTSQIDNMLAEPRRIVNGRDDLMIVVTFVGELRSRKGIRIIRAKDGWYEGTGYAQSGQGSIRLYSY